MGWLVTPTYFQGPFDHYQHESFERELEVCVDVNDLVLDDVFDNTSGPDTDTSETTDPDTDTDADTVEGVQPDTDTDASDT